MKRRLTTLILFVFILNAICMVAGCSKQEKNAIVEESVKPNNIAIASGNTGGTYYYIGAGMAEILNRKMSEINFTTESTTGSVVENSTFTSNSPNTIAMVTLDGLYAAIEGDKERGFKNH